MSVIDVGVWWLFDIMSSLRPQQMDMWSKQFWVWNRHGEWVSLIQHVLWCISVFHQMAFYDNLVYFLQNITECNLWKLAGIYFLMLPRAILLDIPPYHQMTPLQTFSMCSVLRSNPALRKCKPEKAQYFPFISKKKNKQKNQVEFSVGHRRPGLVVVVVHLYTLPSKYPIGLH